MPINVTPGQFVDEINARAAIKSVAADLAVFVGVAAKRAPDQPAEMPITSAAVFEAQWLSSDPAAGAADPLLAAVRLFFANGGRRLHLAPVAPSDASAAGYGAAIASIDAVEPGLIAAPDARFRLSAAEADTVMAALVGWAGTMGTNRLALLDPPAAIDQTALADWRRRWNGADAVLYWPWLALPEGAVVPPSGALAGVIAASEIDRGIAKAPANMVVAGIAGLAEALDARRLDDFNAININCIRALPGRGIRVWGARTLADDAAFRFISVRRLNRMIAVSAAQGMAWVAFEPNGPALWARIREMLEAFLFDLWRAGALMGNKADTAFFVRCDASTTSPADLAGGRVIAEIGFAPLRQAEFQLLRMTMQTA